METGNKMKQKSARSILIMRQGRKFILSIIFLPSRFVPPCIKYCPGVVLDVVLSTTAPIDPYHPGTIINELNVNPLSSSSTKGSESSSIVTLAKSVSGLATAAEFSTDLPPAEPHQGTLTKRTTTCIHHQLKTLNAAVELANQSGRPLSTKAMQDLIGKHLVPPSNSNDTQQYLERNVDMLVRDVGELKLKGNVLEQLAHKMIDMQQQALDRLALIQSKTEAILTQNYELLEYTFPRLFIVLPETSTSWDLATMFHTKFRLHFICECGEHTKPAEVTMAPASKIPHELHLAKHEGYVVNKPTEFFKKYGPFLMVMLEMIKKGAGIAGSVMPIVAAINTATSEGIDYSLKYLEETRALIKKLDGVDVENDAKAVREDLTNYLAGVEGLEGADLRQLGSYLAASSSDNLLGSMYRMTTKDGHVKWVCRDHYRASYQEKHTQKLREVVEAANGFFDEQLGGIEIVLRSGPAAAEFYDAVSKAKGILHLDVSMRWHQHYADFVKLKDMVSKSNIRAIKVDLACKTALMIDKIKINSKNRRYDPIFEIMRLPSIQSFEIERTPFDFFDRSNRLPSNADLPNLKRLRIDGPRIADAPGFKVIGFDRAYIAKLKSLVAQAPNLSRLSLTASLRFLPELFSSIAELQKYPIVFENLMLRFLPAKTESRLSRPIIRNLEDFFRVYGTQLEMMECSEFTLQGLEYDGGDRIAAKEWLQLEGAAVPVRDQHLDGNRIKDLGIIVGPLEG